MPWQCRACARENADGTRFCGHCGAPAVRPESRLSGLGQPREQRRLLTALFVDISGFTSLSEQVDPETLSEIIDTVITRLGDVVTRHGGTVLNYAGDALLAGFGLPSAAEDDAERALSTALEMLDELDELRQLLPGVARALTMHVGVNSGHAVGRFSGTSAHVAYTVLGDAVNVAQRLEAAAPTGQIYVGELTVKLGGSGFALEHVGPIAMKGKAEPVEVWRLVGRRHDAMRQRGHVPSTAVGRAEQLAELERVAGDGGVLALVGDAGMGKSTIVTEVARRTVARTRWVFAGCHPYGGGAYTPWGPIVAALTTDERLPAWLSGEAAEAEEGAGATPAARRRALHRRVIELVARASPIIVVLDDLQWADTASVDLACELAEATQRSDFGRIGLVVTARPEAEERVARVLEAAGGRGRSSQLEPFARAALGELTRAVLGERARDDLLDLVLEHSGGNPFFATELLHHLSDGRSIERTTDGWGLVPGPHPTSVPPTVEELVGGELDRLPAQATETLELAAAVGTYAPTEVLLRAAHPGDPLPQLEQLVRAGLLRYDTGDEPAYVFRNALVQSVAYERLLRRDRKRLHSAIADAWEATPVDSSGRRDAAIADHLYQADAGRRAIDALHNVARQAAALYANRTACEQIDRALELAGRTALPREQLAALQLERAELAVSLGDLPDAIERFAPHVGGDAGEQDARAALGLARALRLAGRYDEALDLLDEIGAARLVAPARLALERAGVDLMEGHVHEAIAQCDPYLAHPGEAPHDSELLLIRAQARAALDDPPAAIADAELALSLARAERAAAIEARALRVLGGLYDEVDRLDDAAAALQQALDAAEAAGDVGELAGCLVNLAFLEQRRGDLPRTIALDRRAVAELHRIGHGFEAGARANLAHHLVDAGLTDEAGRATEQALASAARVGDELARADSLYAAARLAMAVGDHAGAVARAEQSLALLQEIGTAAMVPDIEALLAAARQAGAATVTSGTSQD